MAYACKTSSARSIVGVIPYLPYSKQCKMRKRGCIVSKLLAKVRLYNYVTMVLVKFRTITVVTSLNFEAWTTSITKYSCSDDCEVCITEPKVIATFTQVRK